MSNASQAGSLDRGHQVGCPLLRDPLAAEACTCVKKSKFFEQLRQAKTGGVRPDSARLYRNIAAFRKFLAENDDVPAEMLRDMLLRALEAAELLSTSLDEAQDILQAVVRR